MLKTNPKLRKICAFCANWYDPANAFIRPSKPYSGVYWKYDESAQAPCFKKQTETKSVGSCSAYIPKKLWGGDV